MATSNYRQIRTARAHNVTGTIKRTVGYITRKHKLLFILSIVGVLISSLTGVISSYFFKPIINDYIVPYIGKENPDMSGFIKMLTIMAIIYIIGVIFSYIKQKAISLMATGMLDELRTDLFNKMQNLPVSFFDRKGHGEIMVYYTNDIDMIRPMIAETFPTLLSVLVTIVGCFAFMAALNFKLMLLVLLCTFVIIYVTKTVAKNSNKYFASLQVQVSNINGYIEEYFSGQKVVKVFNHEDEVIEGFKKYNDELYKNSVRTNMIGSIMFPVNVNLSYLTMQ